MKITEKKIAVRELCQNYRDDNEGGVYGYDDGKHMLTFRPAYQREFVYPDKKREAVINTVVEGFPLGLMYWSKIDDDRYECLDGQQRSISIAQYVNSDFPVNSNGNARFFHNLTPEEKENILNYELEIHICEGTEKEKLAWFKRINVAGVTLTNQELLNATYTGPWLSDAKKFFSKRNCAASQFGDGYIKGNPIRQELLEKVLEWVADRDGYEGGQVYMAHHQHDDDANDLWVYFQNVINWAKTLFPNKLKGITDAQSWGILYNMYHENKYNSNKLQDEIRGLLKDDDVTKQAGIIPYLLSDRKKSDEKLLSIRVFTDNQKRKKYEEQVHKCAICGEEFDFDDMEGDHILPWSRGGHTTYNNLQMLCRKCNNEKSDN